MLTRQLAASVRRTLNLINYCSIKNIPLLVMALDAEKAFDHFETTYLFQLLEYMNFGPNFLQAIQALYKEPCAQLIINNLRLKDFSLMSSTCQGGPL